MDAVYRIKNEIKTLICSTTDSTKVMSYHKCDTELNSAGSLEFDIPMINPMRNSLSGYDLVSYERDGIELFRGNIITESNNILNTGKIEAEGRLARLNDVNMEPYDYSGDVEGFVELLLDYYNSKAADVDEILLGTVTVTDPNDYIVRSSTKRNKILDIMSESLVEKLGGYLRIRVQNGVEYLDYISDFGRVSNQSIQYGKNLIDIADSVSYGEVYSVVTPLGQTYEDGTQMTIQSVNDGSPHIINEQALAMYGWKEVVVEYDDVTEPINLFRKGQNLSIYYASPVRTIEVNAVDLPSEDRWHLGDVVHCTSEHNNLSADLVLSAATYFALERESERFTLGQKKKKYSVQVNDRLNSIESNQQAVERYNGNLSERINNATGLYCTIEEQEDGSTILWQHDKPDMNESNLLMNVSSEGVHVSPDGGAVWYGFDFDGEWFAHLIDTYKISARYIYGDVLQSRSLDSNGEPVSYWDLESGDVRKHGPILEIARETGNVSYKWVGGVDNGN